MPPEKQWPARGHVGAPGSDWLAWRVMTHANTPVRFSLETMKIVMFLPALNWAKLGLRGNRNQSGLLPLFLPLNVVA